MKSEKFYPWCQFTSLDGLWPRTAPRTVTNTTRTRVKTLSCAFLAGLVALGLLFADVPAASAQSTAFTYQGRLGDHGAAANGGYDFLFSLYDASTNGNQIGDTLTGIGVSVTNGLFTEVMDFGSSIFTGADRWLQIGVRTNGSTNFSLLSPRQALTPEPYAIYAGTAGNVSAGAISSAQIAVNAVGAANLQSNAVTGSKIAAGQVVKSLNGLRDDVILVPGSGLSMNTSGNVLQLSANIGNYWNVQGNGGTGGANFLGTLDNQPLELRVNNTRALRLEPNTNGPNVIGGFGGNSVSMGTTAATIGGGGTAGAANTIQADDSFIGGGLGNLVQPGALHGTIGGGGFNGIQGNAYDCTIAGGWHNSIGSNSFTSVISGGAGNAIEDNADDSLISGGRENRITKGAIRSTIGGGPWNLISSPQGTIGGGESNSIRTNSNAAVIGGGISNTNSGPHATIGGGANNLIQTNASTATIAGGGGNLASANNAAIIGGSRNTAGGDNSTVGGGYLNVASGTGAFVGGGYLNSASGLRAAIAGGNRNNATQGSFIGAGGSNTAFANSFIGAGYLNVADNASVVGGGNENRATNFASVVGGGFKNKVSGETAFVGGGYLNSASGLRAAIAGGMGNTASGETSFIGAGNNNTAIANSFIGAGYLNVADNGSVVGGGNANQATNFASVVGGGFKNKATGRTAFVGAGYLNVADGIMGAVAGGQENDAAGSWSFVGGGYGNTAKGQCSAIPGGFYNSATNDFSFAAGHRAKANHRGAFVWADSTDADVASTTNNQFSVRASGGVVFYSDPTSAFGAYLPPGGGAFSSLSDRNAKTNNAIVDGRGVLERLATIQIATWNYRSQPDAVRHIGPMAQDFARAFGVGEDEKHISTVDADGVALAAIQGLNLKLQDELKKRDAENAELKMRLDTLERMLNQITRK
jgi:hypothetical protein